MWQSEEYLEYDASVADGTPERRVRKRKQR
jgi:hypothetical protein